MICLVLCTSVDQIITYVRLFLISTLQSASCSQYLNSLHLFFINSQSLGLVPYIFNLTINHLITRNCKMKTFAPLLLVAPFASAALTSMTQNDVTNGGGCKAMTVLFARGTTELGNMGSVAGPPFVSAVGKMMGGAQNLAVQGIAYPADIPGFLAGGDAAGSKLMAQMVGQVMAACPDTALVMAGYS